MSCLAIVSFIVLGVPQPQGSMRAMLSRTTGRPMVKSDNAKLHGWRQQAGWAARHALGNETMFYGPVKLRAAFVLVRPKSVSVKKRPWPIVKPDADKLLRALCDALTGILWRDDAQVIDVSIVKIYGVLSETQVTVMEVA